MELSLVSLLLMAIIVNRKTGGYLFIYWNQNDTKLQQKTKGVIVSKTLLSEHSFYTAQSQDYGGTDSVRRMHA